ncbi:ROK family protein [Streptomyces sp. NPDC088794]|uniref:ROK family protein n=1 Tax=Streptomyces sp. NPDC088794 TaxID=3365902 RepID=UPI00381E3D84
MASPGPLDPETGVVLNPPMLPGWQRVELRTALQLATGLPVLIEKDATAAVVSEVQRVRRHSRRRAAIDSVTGSLNRAPDSSTVFPQTSGPTSPARSNTAARKSTSSAKLVASNQAKPEKVAESNQASPVNAADSKSASSAKVADEKRTSPRRGWFVAVSLRASSSRQSSSPVNVVPRWSMSWPASRLAR